MKLQLKKAFQHVFTGEDAKPFELIEVFITIATPVLLAVVVFLLEQPKGF